MPSYVYTDALWGRFHNLIEDARYDGASTDEIRQAFKRAIGDDCGECNGRRMVKVTGEDPIDCPDCEGN